MVSAIITTHNRADLLDRAIQSVLNQTYKDIELIVVSDGSTDGTDEVMKQFESDERVNYISYHPGRGGNYARNTGIKAAKGEHVAFLDDDDEWLPTKIEKQVALMDADKEVGLVYTGINCVYVNEGIDYPIKQYLRGDLSKIILFQNCIGSTSSVMLRKNYLNDTGFDENLQARQDYDLWISVLQKCKADVVVEPMVNYFNYRNQVQVSSSTLKYVRATEYLNKKYSSLFSKLTPSEYRLKEFNDMMLFGNKAIRNNFSNEARKYFLHAFKIKPSLYPLMFWVITFGGYKNMLRIKNLIK